MLNNIEPDSEDVESEESKRNSDEFVAKVAKLAKEHRHGFLLIYVNDEDQPGISGNVLDVDYNLELIAHATERFLSPDMLENCKKFRVDEPAG